MAHPIIVQDLPQHPAPGVHLHCWECHAEYSAQRDDYFMADPKTVMRCCGQPLELLRQRTVYEPA